VRQVDLEDLVGDVGEVQRLVGRERGIPGMEVHQLFHGVAAGEVHRPGQPDLELEIPVEALMAGDASQESKHLGLNVRRYVYDSLRRHVDVSAIVRFQTHTYIHVKESISFSPQPFRDTRTCARAVIRDTLAAAALSPDDVAWVMPHNVSLRSWEILLRLVPRPFDPEIRDGPPGSGSAARTGALIRILG
jgi:hypothetical protein